jgi:hypothetical protein
VKNPNVVVLRSDTKWWDDAVLSRPISLAVKDVDAQAAVAALAKAAGLPMTAVMPPLPPAAAPPAPAPPAANPPANGTPPANPPANGTADAGRAAVAPAPPAGPPKASLEVKEKPIREVMLSLAAAYRMNWRKEGPNYVLRDDNLSTRLLTAPAGPAGINAQRTPNMNNNNRRRGPVERAPGVYRAPRQRRR